MSPVTKVHSRWVSGDLIFYDASTLASSGYVLRIAENEIEVYVPMTLTGDVSLEGDLTLTTEDVSVARGRYVYFAGQDATEYITSRDSNELVINAQTIINLGIAADTRVRLWSTILAPARDDIVALGSTSLQWSDLFLASAGTIVFNNDVTITHAANLLTVSGGNLRMGTTDRLEFRDATEYINSGADGYIDIEATTAIRPGIDLLTDRWQASITHTLIGMGVAGAGNLTAGNTNCTGFGYNALNAVTSGDHNSAFGASTMALNTTGVSNAAFGRSALAANTTGHYNSAFGSQALQTNTTGTGNTAVGFYALALNTTGGANTAVGFEALGANTTGGTQNSALGYHALRANTTGDHNVAVGHFALVANTTGVGNIGIGQGAGDNITTGDYCIIIGYALDAPSATTDAQLYIGATTAAMGYILGDNAGDMTINAVTSKLIQLAIAGTDEVTVSGAALYPATDNGQTLGILNTNEWSDLFLADGGVIGWNNNDVTITHSSNTLTIGSMTDLVFGNSSGKITDASTSISIYGGNGSSDSLNLYSQSAGTGNDYIKIAGNSTMTLKSTSTITLTGVGITLDPTTSHVTIQGGENLQLGTSSSTGGVFTCYKDASGGIGFRVTTAAITLGVPISAANDMTFSANRHLLCSAGATYFDFSSGTGVFKTTSGTNYLNGNVTIAGSKNVSMGNATTKGGDFAIYRDTSGVKSFEVDVTTGIFMGDEVVFDRGRTSYTMLFDVNKAATYAFDFVSAQAPLTALAADVAGDNTSYKLAIKIGASTYYLAVWGSGAWS